VLAPTGRSTRQIHATTMGTWFQIIPCLLNRHKLLVHAALLSCMRCPFCNE
jgi:hypothetical protein